MTAHRRVYLDHNASAPLRPVARAAAVAALELVGNPSSVHAEGRTARAIVETAREQVARLVGAEPAEVVFTSGATEANNLALSGGYDAIFVAGIEHDSVLAPARRARVSVMEMPVGRDGVVAVESIACGVLKGPWSAEAGLIALQLVNNETGVIQPVAETAAFAKEHGLHLHCDSVQAVGRLPVHMAELGADTLSLSSHKLGGPKGAGALIVRNDARLTPSIVGGAQERRRRAGTENVPAIAGFGAAAEAAKNELQSMTARMAALRQRLEAGVRAISSEAIVIGEASDRVCNTSLIALPGAAAETLVIKFDLAGVAVSAGSACSSGKVGASHVLAAMGLPADVQRSAIRVSVGATTTEEEIATFLEVWREVTARAALRRVA